MTPYQPYWCTKTIKQRTFWCLRPILREVNSFFMLTLFFVLINLYACWTHEWKHLFNSFFVQVSSAATTSLRAVMANVSRKICYVMATLRVKMVQTKTTVNVLPACSIVRMEDASWQHPCAMEQMTVPMATTKKIAVSIVWQPRSQGLSS